MLAPNTIELHEFETKALFDILQKFVKYKVLHLRYFVVTEFYNILLHMCLMTSLVDRHDSNKV